MPKGHELSTVCSLDECSQPIAAVFENGVMQNQPAVAPVTIDLSPAASRPTSRLRVTFATPTELKSGQQIANRPEFAVLASRARDRISTLRQLYGDGPLPIDFKAFSDRASRVNMTFCQLQTVDVERRSTRTGQVHSLGGFVGEAEYEGDLTEFVPYLRAARFTGVGRQTVWGKGEIRLQPE